MSGVLLDLSFKRQTTKLIITLLLLLITISECAITKRQTFGELKQSLGFQSNINLTTIFFTEKLDSLETLETELAKKVGQDVQNSISGGEQTKINGIPWAVFIEHKTREIMCRARGGMSCSVSGDLH